MKANEPPQRLAAHTQAGRRVASGLALLGDTPEFAAELTRLAQRAPERTRPGFGTWRPT